MRLSSNVMRAVAAAVVVVVAGASMGSPARAEATRSYVACLPTGPELCTAAAANGATVTLTGAGTLTPYAGAATGGGTYVITDAGGTVTEAGAWAATGLQSFSSYGNDASVPILEGGLARLQIALTSGATATLTIDCLIGNVPAGAAEGFRLAIDGGENFSTSTSGETVFFTGA